MVCLSGEVGFENKVIDREFLVIGEDVIKWRHAMRVLGGL